MVDNHVVVDIDYVYVELKAYLGVLNSILKVKYPDNLLEQLIYGWITWWIIVVVLWGIVLGLKRVIKRKNA